MQNHIHVKRKNMKAFLLGAVFLALALVGLVTIILSAIQATQKLLDQSDQKQEYAKIIAPVVMFDTVAFDNVAKLDNKSILQSSIWKILIDTQLGDSENQFNYDDTGLVVIPASDVEIAAKKLFGPKASITHESFTDYESTSYYYDEETKSYHLPMMGKVPLYVPKVEKIEREGSYVNLTVGFVPPGSTWGMDLNNTKYEPQPAKYMMYQLMDSDDGLIIYSVSEIKQEDLGNLAPSGADGQAASSQTSSTAESVEAAGGSEDGISVDLNKTT